MANPNVERMRRLLQARHPLLWCATAEDAEATEVVVTAAMGLGRPLQRWSAMSGLVDGAFVEDHQYEEETARPEVALHHLRDHRAGGVILLQDLGDHLDSPVIMRGLREVVFAAERFASTVVLVDHRSDLPETITRYALRFDLTLPEGDELDRQTKEILRRLQENQQTRVHITKGAYARIVDHLRGLSRRQARQVVTAAALEDGSFDEGDIGRVAELRRELLHREGLLEDIATPDDFDRLAGFGRLKQWFERRHPSRLPSDVPAPRGALLLGVPGSGKSYSVRCAAKCWDLPLLRLDAGSLYNAYIGESERRLRQCLAQAGAMAPCVLWIDEIEKAFASAASRSSDGGLSQRMFGYLLTWMQDHPEAVFLLATANDIQALPPELLRKGRFDQIFFVDLPDHEARRELLALHWHGDDADIDELAAASEGYTGAEIEHAVIAARIDSGEDRPRAATVEAALRDAPPLSATMAEQIAALRQWATGRCLPVH